MHRHQDPIRVDARQPFGIDVLHRRLGKAERGGTHLVIHRRGRECAVQDDAGEHVATTKVRRDRARCDQLCINREIAELAVRHVDQAAGIDHQRAGAQLDARIRPAFLQRGVDRNIKLRRGEPLDGAFEVEAGLGEAAHLNMAVPCGDVQVRQLPAAQGGQRAALPRRPITLPADRGGERRLGAREAGDQPAGGREQSRVHIQLVLVGHRVQAEPQRITAGHTRAAQRRRIDRQLRAAIGDMGRPLDLRDIALSGNRRLHHEPGDAQPIDIDV